MQIMARRRRCTKLFFGIIIGLIVSRFMTSDDIVCSKRDPIIPLRIIDDENVRALNKNLLFVGVMTAAKYLDSRAKAAYYSWGQQVPGKVMFYSSEFSYSEHVPLVTLKGVDDRYPPQKKSFQMLKHIHDNFIDQYEWFLRADDDVYIRTDRLELLLRSVDSRKPWFIGQTGRGNNEEFGLLSLDDDENFCMGGPGVIFSRETLRRIAPHLNTCYERLYTTHEDVELGRCVRKYAGISCTWSYEMQVILYHNHSGEAAFTGDLKQKEVHRAITLHPVKQPQYMLKLHKYVKGLSIQEKQQESILLHRDIAASMIELGYRIKSIYSAELVPDLPLFPNDKGAPNYLGDTSFLGIPNGLARYTPMSLENIQEWEIISRSLYSHRDFNPRRRIGSSLKEGLSDAVREIMELINSYSKQRGRVIDFKEILYGYWRMDPLYGADLILDLLLVYRKYRGHKMTVQVRRHAYVQQTFTGIFIRELDNFELSSASNSPCTTESVPIHKKFVFQIISKISENLQPLLNYHNNSTKTLVNFVMPLSGRYSVFQRFLKMFENSFVKDEYYKLLVVLYRNDKSPDDFEKTIQLVKQFNSKYYNSVEILQSNETFSRGRALQLGVNHLQNNDLMLFIDVDMSFNDNAIDRVRKNTILNEKIYFPIVYSLYNPKVFNKTYSNTLEISQDIVDNDSGFWRQFGFGIVSLYKSDYVNLGGFDLQISGWGNEDVMFYDNVIKSKLKIVRSPDPDFIHVYHPVECDDHLDGEQRTMCLGTRASLLGSLKQLQQIFLKYKDLLR